MTASVAPPSGSSGTSGRLDVVVSFVLFDTPLDEVRRVVEQTLQSRLNLLVYLIDNSSVPLDLGEFDDPRIRRIHNARNLGYGAAHNIAFKRERGRARYHAVLNTDLTFAGGLIDELVAFLDARPAAGLAMPKVVYPDGSLQYLCRLLPTPVDIFGRILPGARRFVRRRNRRYEFHDWHYDSVAEFPFLSGCFMLIRSAVLDRTGGFDERFFLYFEDADLSRRINALAETLYVPLGPVIHEYRTRQRRNLRARRNALASAARYFSKWGWWFDRGRTDANRKALTQAALTDAFPSI